MSRNGIGIKQAVEGTRCTGPLLTVQADRNEVDINRIVARVEKGLAVPVFHGEPFYGDVSELGGLQEAMIKVRESEELFMQYPADVREKFKNDPIEFVNFLSDPENLEQVIEMGLAKKKPELPALAPASPAPAAGSTQ